MSVPESSPYVVITPAGSRQNLLPVQSVATKGEKGSLFSQPGNPGPKRTLYFQ